MAKGSGTFSAGDRRRFQWEESVNAVRSGRVSKDLVRENIRAIEGRMRSAKNPAYASMVGQEKIRNDRVMLRMLRALERM